MRFRGAASGRRATHDDATTTRRRVFRIKRRDVNLNPFVREKHSPHGGPSVRRRHPLSPELDENAHAKEGTNMTLAEGGNRPSSSSSSLPRDANGTKIERKKGAAIFSARECSTMCARDATTTTRFGRSRWREIEMRTHPEQQSLGCRVGRGHRPVGGTHWRFVIR